MASAAPTEALDPAVALGQIVGVSVGGPEITPALRHLIVDDKVGCVVLFHSNVRDAAGLRRWVGDLQQLGREAGLPAPVLIAIDQEGGQVDQLPDPLHPLPAARLLGAGGESAVRQGYARAAARLHALGVGLDLAPVADLRTNPADSVIGDRSFGRSAAVVDPLVSAAVMGLHDGGLGATLKHFPGLGGAPGNPHFAIGTDRVTAAAWAAGAGRSFGAGIDAGADAVMTTAVSVPALDASGTPGMFSRPIVSLLRDRLGFSGVVVTDSLSMGGIGAIHPLPEAAVTALEAGNDLLLLGNDDPVYEASAIDALRAAISGDASLEEQVQESAQRVLALTRLHQPVVAPGPG